MFVGLSKDEAVGGNVGHAEHVLEKESQYVVMGPA